MWYRNWIVLTAITLGVSLTLFIMHKLGETRPTLDSVFWVILTIFISVMVILWAIFFYFAFKGQSESTSLGKDPVSTERAKYLWLRGALREFQIPHVLRHDVLDDYKCPQIVMNPTNAIEFRNETAYPDYETGERFYKLQVNVNTGIRQGSMIVWIPLDRGEKYISQNLAYRRRDRTTHNTHVSDEDKYPLTTPTDNNERILHKRVRAAQEDGASMQDIDALLQQHERESQPRQKQQVRRAITKPEITDIEEETPVDEENKP